MKPCYVYDNEVLFDLSEWVGKDYIWDISPEYLLDLIHRYHKTHKLTFVCRDGENPTLSGFLSILENVSAELEIPKDQIELATFAPIASNYITITQMNPLLFAYVLAGQRHSIRNTEFDKKFIGLYSRPTLYRVKAAKFLNTLPGNHSIISYIQHQTTIKTLTQVSEEYFPELDWVTNNTPINQLDDVPLTNNDLISWSQTTELLENTYQRYLIEFVVETDITNPLFFTEKTFRNFLFGKPFLLFSGKGALENLRKMGAKTFAPYINESYDLIDNHADRFDAITKEIERLNLLSIDELTQMALNLQPVFEHNQRLLEYRRLNPQQCNWGPWTKKQDYWPF